MGDNVIETQAREIMARVTSELQSLLEKLAALEKQLAEERAARKMWEEQAEAHRRLAQKLWVELHPITPEEIEEWRNLKLADYSVSADEFRALLDELRNAP